jgi:hypothetical protein
VALRDVAFKRTARSDGGPIDWMLRFWPSIASVTHGAWTRRWILALLWLPLPGVAALGILQGDRLANILIEVGIVAVFALLVTAASIQFAAPGG